MPLLPDENLPKRLKLDFPEHEVFTIRDKQWHGIKNGELLKLIDSKNQPLHRTYPPDPKSEKTFRK